MGMTPAGDEGDADEWDAADLDDEFVSSAAIVEKTAEERIQERLRAEEARRVFDELAADEELAEIQSRRRRRRRLRQASVGLLVVIAMFLGAVATRCTISGDESNAMPNVDAGVGIGAWTATEVPPPAFDQSATPLGAPKGPTTRGAHEFVAFQPDGTTPVAYDPCRPIHYVVNSTTEPRNGAALLDDALDEISAATGLRFEYDGPTSEEPTRDRAAYQPNRYGRSWAPVLIAWTDSSTEPELRGDVVGSAGSVRLSLTGAPDDAASVFVSGTVNLDGRDLGIIGRRDDGEARVRAIIQHELAHLVGLDHVDDEGELMYPTAGERTDFGPGDREGLARLGTGACFPAV